MGTRALIVFALFWRFVANAATYYVATNGNNSWDGTADHFVSGTTGPWANFANVNWNHNKLLPGDVVQVRGGIYYHTNDSTATALFIAGNANGTAANPVTISNYPNEVPFLYGSGTNQAVLDIRGGQWMRFIGLVVTNAYRSASFQNITNCEIAYCTVTGRGNGITDPGYTLGVAIYNNSQSNWVHHNLISDGPYDPYIDSGHGITFGLFFSATDMTSWNLIETNTAYWAGHDVISIYAPSNIIRGNWIHNEAWYSNVVYQQLEGTRCMELGGNIGDYCLVEGNRLSHAGPVYHGGAHGLEMSGGRMNIIRKNQFLNSTYSGFIIYGGKTAQPCYSNYVYNNTLAFGGFGQSFWTNYSNMTTIDDTIWKNGTAYAHTTNNAFLNNILWANYSNSWVTFDGPTNLARFVNNLTNTDPLFLDTNDGGPFSQTQPDVHLATNSPAIDAGAWLTTITSANGSGTSFNVADALYFFSSWGTSAGHTVPSDIIQLQGQTNQATITGISGNTITVNTSLSWVNGQGVALAYTGVAPDVGAFESAQPTADPQILVTPGSLDFGTTGIPFPKTLTLSVTNVGGGTLSGTASVVGGAPYSITAGASYSLAANAGQNVTVQFAPTAIGSFSDSVVFTGGGGASIPVTGSVTNIITTIISGTTVISGITVIK